MDVRLDAIASSSGVIVRRLAREVFAILLARLERVIVEAINEDLAALVLHRCQRPYQPPGRVRQEMRRARMRVARHAAHGVFDITDTSHAERHLWPSLEIDATRLPDAGIACQQ